MEMLWVAFGDEAYFSLAADPTMAQWLSLGPEIVVVDSQGTALRITTDAEEAARHPRVDPSVAPAAVPAATPTLPAEAPDAAASQNAWDAFWAWLWDQITPN
jgi:hypothetical protein